VTGDAVQWFLDDMWFWDDVVSRSRTWIVTTTTTTTLRVLVVAVAAVLLVFVTRAVLAPRRLFLDCGAFRMLVGQLLVVAADAVVVVGWTATGCHDEKK
jgi:hypothetical protein